LPVPVIQVTEEFRYPDAPRATASDLAGTLLHVSLKADSFHLLNGKFSEIEPFESVPRLRDGVPRTPFRLYRLSGFQGEPLGRIP
jgi:hypothetical protein